MQGRFQPQRLIGHGGAAQVLLAHDAELDGLVAIKVMRVELAADSLHRARFESEVDLLERLAHPGIVPVLARGETAEGAPWYAMPHFPGGSLAEQVMGQGAVTLSRLAGLTLEVLDALQYAHTEGVVHRDVKPDNILLDEHDVAVLCDFGIAADPMARTTRAGAQLGTPMYAAPEQVLDPRLAGPPADLYGLGVAMFSSVTLRSPARLVFEHTRGEALDGLPDGWRDVIGRATEAQVNRRYSSAAEMAGDVADLL